MQTSVLLISFLGMAFVAAAFYYVITNSGSREDDYSAISSRGYRIRRWWMVGLCAVGVLVTAWSLMPFPIKAAISGDARSIDVVGKQWSWDIDSTSAKVGESVRFRVTSSDVNHGFALYSPDNKIVAQTQAMPGYINNLDVTFEQPGVYRVLCLEYCGVAHHAMIAKITVTEEL